ncbi:MAG TPA: hypothetical protein VFY93_18225 [Planctomycetota bacterium]|nr:hypothetical protein [Planctomycetota bacterium]
MLLHGVAPLAARYLAAAGLGRLLVTGAPPPLGATDPSFRLLGAKPGEAADVVLDLGDGAAWRSAPGRRIWGGASGAQVLLGVEPRECAPHEGAARAVLEMLGAAEALRALLGLEPRRYDFR